jgi:hypothetical protein
MVVLEPHVGDQSFVVDVVVPSEVTRTCFLWTAVQGNPPLCVNGEWAHSHSMFALSIIAMRISGHKTCSIFDRYNIVDDKDLRQAALSLSILPQIGGISSIGYLDFTSRDNSARSPLEIL